MNPTIRNRRHSGFLLFTGLFMVLASSVRATDLFQIQASAPGVPTATVSAKSLPNLVEDLVKSRDQFANFAGAPSFDATLNYAGVPNALHVSVANGTPFGAPFTVHLTSALSGLDRTFSGPDSSSVFSQIKDYLTKNAASDLAALYKQLNARSLVGVTDGNPNSSTAFMARQWYDQFAMSVGQTRDERDNFKDYQGHFTMGLAPDVGFINANGFHGTTYSLPIYMDFKLADRVGLAFDLPLNYTSLEGANIFQVGLSLGVPVEVIQRSQDSRWQWQLTPTFGGVGSGSFDLAAGGLLLGGAFSSMLAYDLDWCTLSMGNQIAVFQGEPILGFDPGVSQQLLSNGLKMSVPLGRRWLFEPYGVYNRFLDAAAVQNYFTVGGNLVYRLLGKASASKWNRGYLFVGGYADLAGRYTAPHIALGTGWKF